MKKFIFLMFFTTCITLFFTHVFSQEYAASQMVTTSNGTSTKVAYLEATNPSNTREIAAENLEIIWQKNETYAIGQHSYYSKVTDKSVVNWDLNDKRVAQYANTSTAIWEFPTSSSPKAFSNKTGSMYIVTDGAYLNVLNPENGEVIYSKTFPLAVSYAAAFPDGAGFYCSVGEYPGEFTVYSFLLSSETPVWSLTADNSVVGIAVSEDHSQVIVCLSQPATKALIVEPATGAVKQELYYYNNSPSQSPAFSANGEYLVLADFSGKGTLYKRINGIYEMQWQASLQTPGATSVWGCGQSISADGSTIAFGTLDFVSSGYGGSIFVYNNYSNVPIWQISSCGDMVSYISITDDGSMIACAGWGPLVQNAAPDLYIFRKESSDPLCTLTTQGTLFYVDIAPDGSKGIATGKAVHAREMGWGGNAYCFKPAPSSYGNISGNVNLIGSDDNSFALLTLENMDNYYALSNVAGDFSIKYIPAGTYSLTASKQGYVSKTVTDIVVTGENTTTVNIELEPVGEPVQNLFASQGAYEHVLLVWQKYTEPHIGFNIYRKLNENAPFTEIFATVDANETGFIDDTALPTINYYYAVTAIINTESEGPFSNTALGYTSTSFITKEIDVYHTENKPVIDGVISEGEWDDAFVFDASDFLGSDGTYQPVGSVIIYMKSCLSMKSGEMPRLFVAVQNFNDTQLSAGDRTALYIDDNNNGVYEEPGNESEGNYWINYGPAGNYSVQYRPIYNTGGVGAVYDLTPTVAASDATGYVVAEFSISMEDGDHNINPGPGNKSKAYIYVRDGAAAGTQDGQWPYDNPETFNPIGYGTLNFFVNDEVPPPPTNLRYQPFYFDSPEFVAIAWDSPQINDLGHFNVKITNVNTGFEDTYSVAGNQLIYEVEDSTKYHVTVTTVDKAGHESVPSEVLEIITQFHEIKVDEYKTVFKIYPNPTTGELRIESGELRINNVEVYDIMGRKQKIIVNYQLSIINCSHLPAGLYFIKVGNSVQKFVKH